MGEYDYSKSISCICIEPSTVKQQYILYIVSCSVVLTLKTNWGLNIWLIV